MFQPGLLLPLDSIDKRRNNENIQSSRSDDQPQPSNQDIPTDQSDERRWISSASKQFPENSEIQAALQEEAVGVSSSRQNENSGRVVSLENWRKISQIAADDSLTEQVRAGPRPVSRSGNDGHATDKCIDKNCINPLNSASAKTSQSAKSELEGSEVLPSSTVGGRQVDPPENETRSENRNNNAKSSPGERKRLKVIWILFKHFNTYNLWEPL